MKEGEIVSVREIKEEIRPGMRYVTLSWNRGGREGGRYQPGA